RLLLVDQATFWEQVMTLPLVARNLLREQTQRVRKQDQVLLEKREKELRLKQIEHDLDLAREIQKSALPTRFNTRERWPHLDIHARMVPAREVGGDLYDAFGLDAEHLFFAVGDVTGKGISAALFMMRTSALFRSVARPDQHPVTFLESVSLQLQETTPGYMFVTVFCGVMNTRSGRVVFANAGHPRPILRKADGHCAFVDVPTGMVAGILRHPVFGSGELTLHPGESLLIYTDGASEANNRDHVMLGEERLLATVRQAPNDSAEALVSAAFAGIAAHVDGADPSDDVTLLAIHWS
ncbi:MAG: SpoIIE family protein phosphatase, partial [Magnetococcus sp. WYHC-3]